MPLSAVPVGESARLPDTGIMARRRAIFQSSSPTPTSSTKACMASSASSSGDKWTSVPSDSVMTEAICFNFFCCFFVSAFAFAFGAARWLCAFAAEATEGTIDTCFLATSGSWENLQLSPCLHQPYWNIKLQKLVLGLKLPFPPEGGPEFVFPSPFLPLPGPLPPFIAAWKTPT